MSSAETSSAFLKVFTMIFNNILAFNFLIESKYVAKNIYTRREMHFEGESKRIFKF